MSEHKMDEVKLNAKVLEIIGPTKEPAPNFFAPDTDIMPLINWCDTAQIGWSIGRWVRDEICHVCLRRIWTEGEAEGEHVFPAAALTIAICNLGIIGCHYMGPGEEGK